MLLNVSELFVSYGVQPVLNNVSFTLDERQRAGLVGANGAGKSTLLKAITGQVAPDSGRIAVANGAAVGYLPQAVSDYTSETIDDLIYQAQGDLRQLESRLRELEQHMGQPNDNHDELLTEYGHLTEQFERRGGYELDYRIDQVLGGLRLSHIARDRRVATLSGGEKSRVGLAALLLKSPDLLLLDEPTNHLDFFALEWLEGYLSAYSGGLLVASHDREFLNRIVNFILEIDEHTRQMKQYKGNYDAYAEAKAIERVNWLEDYLAQQEELKELRHALKTQARQLQSHNRPPRDNFQAGIAFKEGRANWAISRNVRSVEERLARIEANPIHRPPEAMHINPDFDPHALEGKTPLTATGLRKSFGSRVVLDDVSFTVGPSDRILIVGPNGAGKSTLLKMLAGIIQPDTGTVRLGNSVKVGYLDQEQETLDPHLPVFDAWRDGRVGYREDLEADFFHYGLFTYEEADKRVGELSVGQKRKLQIARLIAEKANLLLLDEPTNHVSFDVLEEFEKALLDFPGPIIAVSHDRRFIARFDGQAWELREGRLGQG
ncbi:MAG: ABC transporter ATP-binding protein [Candidatus Chloroheliales bacterium]|nr:MAG: ABC transporter ATP-binding protein [Chloroflexota bacterium]